MFNNIIAYNEIKTVRRKRVGLNIAKNFDVRIVVFAELNFVDINDCNRRVFIDDNGNTDNDPPPASYIRTDLPLNLFAINSCTSRNATSGKMISLALIPKSLLMTCHCKPSRFQA